MSFSGFMVKEGSAVSDGAALRYTVHLPWYRSLPLSSVVDIQVQIDRSPLDRDRIHLAVNGGEYTLDQLAQRWEDVWFVQDEAQVVIVDDAVAARTDLEIRTTVLLRSPYIMIGPDTPLVASCTTTRHFTLDAIGATR